MDMHGNPMTLQDLLDRESIRDVITRYGHAIDRHDADLLSSMFWPEAIEDHGMISTGIAEFAKFAFDVSGACVVTAHMIMNILIRLDGNTARVESYGIGMHLIEGPTQPHWRAAPDSIPPEDKGKFAKMFAGARYVDRMEKRGDIWRIAHRAIAYDWYHVVDDQGWDRFPYPGHEDFHFGSCRPDDIGHKLFEGVVWK